MKVNSLNDWLRRSATVKFILIGLLSLVMLIPAAMIGGIVREREQRRNEVVGEVSDKWGGRQVVAGPVLTVPYRTMERKADGSLVYQSHNAHFLPGELVIDGQIDPEIRHRSLYEVILYESDLHISGSFGKPDFGHWNVDPELVMWDQAYLSVGISDLRGIQDEVRIDFGGRTYEVAPGIPSRDVLQSGFSALVDLSGEEETRAYPFEFTVKVNGSESLDFIPAGKSTKVHIGSDWSTPSFTGAFLPDDPADIDARGFRASWNVLQLNRNFPQQWTGSQFDMSEWAFGLSLLFPVDHYQKSSRAVKYAIMFISLTFLLLFFAEILAKKRVHPIQYFLVGFALCIFYVLLISLSEHIGFHAAYLVAGISIVGMLSAYAYSVLKTRKLAATVGLVLAGLYVYLYTILQLEEYSLLIGSVGLFGVMAVVMFLSRKVDWYRPIDKDGDS